MMRRALIVLVFWISFSRCGGGEVDREERDSTNGTASSNDTGAGTEPFAAGSELLYELPDLLLPDIDSIYSFAVDETHIYFQPSSMNLYRVLKDGTGTPELFYGPISAIVFDETYAYMLDGAKAESVTKLDKITLQQQTIALGGNNRLFGITLDADRLYMANHGCTKIVTLTKEGEDLRLFERESEILYGGYASIIVDETDIYCSGSGAGGFYGGRLYRCPKEGGDITEVTTIPDALHEIRAAHNPQVSGMVSHDEYIYFIGNMADGAYLQYLYKVSKGGGEPISLSELWNTYGTQRLHHDIKRNSLYFFAPGKESDMGFYKWDLTSQSLSRILHNEAETPMDADEDYLYWAYHDKIYRMKKF